MNEGQEQFSVGRWASAAIALGGFLLLLIAGWVVAATPVGRLQRDLVHWNYLVHAIMIALPLAALKLGGRKDPYLLRRPAAKRWWIIAAVGAFPFIAVAAVDFLTTSLEASRALRQFFVSTIVFQVVFVGIGEELFFRGFLQGELTRAFPARERRISYPAWISAALLFGLGHGMGRFNPLMGRFDFVTGAFIASFVTGCALGLLALRSRSIWPGVMVHIAINIPTVMLRPDLPHANTHVWIAFATAFPLLVFLILRQGQRDSAAS